MLLLPQFITKNKIICTVKKDCHTKSFSLDFNLVVEVINIPFEKWFYTQLYEIKVLKC